jgi:hypothetical protein
MMISLRKNLADALFASNFALSFVIADCAQSHIDDLVARP